MTKSDQIQIRVSPRQKAALKRLAALAKQDVSGYVLSRALPDARVRFGELVRALGDDDARRFALAELNDLLTDLARVELSATVASANLEGLAPLWSNYVAAMVEHAAWLKGVAAPAWVHDVPPLARPHFATTLRGLRLHLLRAAPVAFKRRNIFVDASLGARV